ncbi:nucleoside-triphosphate pyrophosphatase [Brucella abortus]|nr:nucleoside-triphosphate pyrophosphatase [Brucella abortus]
MKSSRNIDRLLEIMAALRNPETGCPWDIEQNFRTIAPYTLEETYEVLDAIERDDMDDLREELGDLLLQVVFHVRMAEEQGYFAFGDVVEAITHKMIRRHPHVSAMRRHEAPEWPRVHGTASRRRKRQSARKGVQNWDWKASGKPAFWMTFPTPSLPFCAR